MTATLGENLTAIDIELARSSSRELAQVLASQKEKTKDSLQICVQPDGGHGKPITIPVKAFRLLTDMLTEMAKGNSFTLVPLHAELTTQQAADLLNVSRPFLIDLLETNKLPYRMVGSHRRVFAKDVLEYKRQIDLARLKTLEELTGEAQELNMGY